MKKNVRNALAISGLAIAIGASGLTLTASAHPSRNGNGPRFERQQNPSKIARIKKVDRGEKTNRHRRTLPGIVTAVSNDEIIMTKGSKKLTVKKSAETRILNRKWDVIEFSQIKIGDKIRVIGTLADKTITAQTIRNVSLQ